MAEHWKPFYRIKTGKDGGSGSFLCPPGHPRHSYSLWGYESPRHRNEMSIGAIDSALDADSDASDAVKRRVQQIMDEAEIIPSELWIRHVYGYFRNSYAPEDKDRNLSRSITHSPAEIAVTATRKALADHYRAAGYGPDDENYRDGSKRPMRAARRGYEVTAKRDGSEVFVYTLADDGSRYGNVDMLAIHAATLTAAGYTNVRIEGPQSAHGSFVPERVRATNPKPAEPIDPERHLAVLCIREYFPDHTPRLDLIENPGKGYGAYPCVKCGTRVQYEAKKDAHAGVTTAISADGVTEWTYNVECPKGGGHVVE
jgi:hypothetical protein